MATIVACGGFSAVCGSSLATAATMSKVALPSMRRYGYSDQLATGAIAAGGRVTFQSQFKSDAPEVKKRLQRFARGNTLLRNDGERFEDVSEAAAVTMGRWAWGSNFVDLNNDGWEDLVAANLKARHDEAVRAEGLIAELVTEFNDWYQEHRVVPAVQQLQDALEELRSREVARNARRFQESDHKQLEHFSKSLMSKVAGLMIANLKRASLEENDLGMAMAVARAVGENGDGELEEVLQRLDNELSH